MFEAAQAAKLNCSKLDTPLAAKSLNQIETHHFSART
jgi:hypothetical protein